MTVEKDEETGYLRIKDISDGFHIVDSTTYDGYMAQINEKDRQIIELQDEIKQLNNKILETVATQAEANKTNAENLNQGIKLMKLALEDARSEGLRVGRCIQIMELLGDKQHKKYAGDDFKMSVLEVARDILNGKYIPLSTMTPLPDHKGVYIYQEPVLYSEESVRNCMQKLALGGLAEAKSLV